MTQVGVEKEPLLFEVVGTRIIEDNGAEKKHILYTLQVRHVLGRDDAHTSTIERRYTDFLNLYTSLKTEHPSLLTSIDFPKKVLTGNFENKLISERSTAFEKLLKHIASDHKLRTSQSLLSFLQSLELTKAKVLLSQKQYTDALPILENIFRLLNKVYTDRSVPVLIALCRVLACCVEIPGTPNAEKWADLTLHRYDGVSDSDLLQLYVPLLHACMKVWQNFGRDKDILEKRLASTSKLGIKVDKNISLIETIDAVEQKIARC